MNDIVLAGEYRPVPVSARHQHDSWELFYCTRGVGILRFDKQDLSYHAGDMVVIPPEVPHSHPIGEGADCLVLGMTNTRLPLHALNLVIILALNLFFGNIPLTACATTSSGFFSIISL